MRMHSRLTAHLSRGLAETTGLSMSDYLVLVVLAEQPGGAMRPYELGSALDWEKSRLSHHIARMAERRLVERRPCPSDQRGQYVVLTPEGRRSLEEAAPVHVAQVRRAFVDRLTPAQLEVLAEIAATVFGGLEPPI